MWHLMRPGAKLKLWTPGYKNQPDVTPPALLRTVSALSIFSIVGVLVYSVAATLSTPGTPQVDAEKAIYVALLHFVLPFAVFYTVSTNSPLSRLLITIYSVVLCAATVAGKGLLGSLPIDETLRIAAATTIFVIIVAWLYGSPKMRYYYCIVGGKPLPESLQARQSELVVGSWLGPKGRERVEWLIENLETAILIGFIVAVVLAYLSM